ncbi:MAG: hypothetical protein NC311_05130 [Muribaculaceae bacterium]|nr:hypothetical protein [Muribaculaceae bacterium]
MSRILIFIAYSIFIASGATAAVRDGTANSRTTSTQRVVSTKPVERTTTSRIGTQNTQQRASTTSARTNARTANTVSSRTTTSETGARATISRAATALKSVAARATTSRPPVTTARAATDTSATAMSQTRTGADYERCKTAYFTCMDQFCQLKNDNYRRCSCNDRVYDLDDAFDTLQQAGEKLTTFTENLDVVGMTAAQATSMKRASEGESTLTSDSSASKALLQAIMNSIRGDDASVGGKYSDLNSINISFDTANAFGTADAGQIIGTYNGKNLYSAVYPQCRQAVRGDCNDASLQRAITAYLMAIEQDCNTVQTAIETKQKQMKSAVREGSAMLDLARVENRKNHNSSDFTTCLNNVEAAVLSEEVCGANYHKCLDNGEFIDISTGKPITGVEKFYELERLLTFSDNVDAANQQLSKMVNNRQFVQNFEKRVKKFAEPALDKCVELADDVWAEYLDRALLAIYYAQKSKVAEIKQGCFDFISSCYTNVDNGLTQAMQALTDGSDIVIQPDKIVLNSEMCRNYVNSCDNMFDGKIITEYINNRTDIDRTTACRAAAKQCFDKFGGTGYQNFYYPYSGLFTAGSALDWLTLYDFTTDTDAKTKKAYKSECAKQLADIDSCKDKVEEVFGGFDKHYTTMSASTSDKGNVIEINDANTSGIARYGTLETKNIENEKGEGKDITILAHHEPRPTGVATEIYYQIVDMLSIQCSNLQGRFLEPQFILPLGSYDTDDNGDICVAKFSEGGTYKDLVDQYGIGEDENMCPRDYGLSVDTKSWGACYCWENGGRRSKWGKSPICVAGLPVPQPEGSDTSNDALNASCNTKGITVSQATKTMTRDQWCTQTINMNTKQVCPKGVSGTECEIPNKLPQALTE